MFSQRNNPYCDSLQISVANIIKKWIQKTYAARKIIYLYNFKQNVMKKIFGLDIGTI